MNQRLQKALLTLFVLLQCVSPIAHAHIDDNNDATHAHQIGTHASAGGSHAENHTHQTISTPRAYRLRIDTAQSHPHVRVTFDWVNFNGSNVTLIPSHKPNITLPSSPHLSPWSQAPPHFIQSI